MTRFVYRVMCTFMGRLACMHAWMNDTLSSQQHVRRMFGHNGLAMTPHACCKCLQAEQEAVTVQIWKETIPALQKLKEEGLLRFIGFSCYPLKPYQYIIEK